VTERSRTTPSAAERDRAQPSAQKLLPIECVAQSDQAYLAALEDCGLPSGVSAIVRWLIVDGRREAGQKWLPVRTQRQLAQRLGLSASTVCESLRRLTDSHLVRQVDGVYRLDLSLLVSVSEAAVERRAAELRPPDPGEVLDRLLGPPRSAALGGVRPRSAALGGAPVSVEEQNPKPVSVSVSETVTVRAGQPLPSAAERGERRDCLKHHPAWEALQVEHFRRGGRVFDPRAMDLQALKRAMLAAVDADLLDGPPEPGESNDRWLETKVRFLATAYDLAKAIPTKDPRTGRDTGVRSPAACLRARTEANALWRISDEGRRWAHAQITEYRAERLARQQQPEYVTAGDREQWD
jgi:hypothetical protein